MKNKQIKRNLPLVVFSNIHISCSLKFLSFILKPEPPISTPNCPRLYGIFPHNSNCRVFYSCWNGEASKYECPPGLAYDDDQRVCVWADLVERCDQLGKLDF